MIAAHTSRNKDGTPRKLRQSTNERAQRRQARMIKEQQLGKKLSTKELVHHRDGRTPNNSPRNLKVVRGQRVHEKIHPGAHN